MPEQNNAEKLLLRSRLHRGGGGAMPSRYGLRVAETLDPAWAAWLGEATIQRNADGSTTLTGRIAAQEQLYQLLHKMGDLGMTLLAVEMTEGTDCSVLSSDTARR